MSLVVGLAGFYAIWLAPDAEGQEVELHWVSDALIHSYGTDCAVLV